MIPLPIICLIAIFVSLGVLVYAQIMLTNELSLQTMTSRPFKIAKPEPAKRKGAGVPVVSGVVDGHLNMSAGFILLCMLGWGLLTGRLLAVVLFLLVLFFGIPILDRLLMNKFGSEPYARTRRTCWSTIALSGAILLLN